MSMWKPLLVGEVFGRQLRFFASPTYKATGEPDGPWFAYEDFIRVIGIDQEKGEAIFRMLRQDWEEPQTIATKDGLITIIPRFMAEGFFDVVDAHHQLFDLPAEHRLVRGRFRNQLSEALKEMTKGMAVPQKLAFVLSLVT